MSRTIANLGRHHFNYCPFRRPGDIHVRFFGTATLLLGDGIQAQVGDTFVEAAPFRRPLRNCLQQAAEPVVVRDL